VHDEVTNIPRTWTFPHLSTKVPFVSLVTYPTQFSSGSSHAGNCLHGIATLQSGYYNHWEE
jgi:hypothetical protein